MHKTNKMNHFTISFYDGEGDDKAFTSITHGKKYPKDGIFLTMLSAALWCLEHKFNVYGISITEWNPNALDEYGTPERVASENLGAAYDNEYHHLTFENI